MSDDRWGHHVSGRGKRFTGGERMTGGDGAVRERRLVRLDGLGGSARGGACWALAQLGWLPIFFCFKTFQIVSAKQHN